ncbi:MAG: polysaccharide deacetylase family protein [candidate division NC10 bacterium]|nr:polysaccharide deacetylase family protein [candidate division NC10 bacterium]
MAPGVTRRVVLLAAAAGLGLLGAGLAVSRLSLPPAATAAAQLLPVLPTRPPNEVGRILILEYHRIGSAEDRWTRSVENFRADLHRLYDEGYRPVSLGDLLDGRVDLPAGLSPVVLTFDDSSPGQFRYLERDGEVQIDPDSAVGILLDFHRAHPDFAAKATFYVLPAAAQPHRLFGQPAHEHRKLRHLVELGFEIGNHTLWHANLGGADAATIRHQLASAVRIIQEAVPGYRVRTLALPFGAYPADLAVATLGEVNGTTYRHEAILMVAGGAAPSPFAAAFDPLHLPRVQATSAELDHWLGHFARRPEDRFVSDGDPAAVTVPQPRARLLRSPLPQGIVLRVH